MYIKLLVTFMALNNHCEINWLCLHNDWSCSTPSRQRVTFQLRETLSISGPFSGRGGGLRLNKSPHFRYTAPVGMRTCDIIPLLLLLPIIQGPHKQTGPRVDITLSRRRRRRSSVKSTRRGGGGGASRGFIMGQWRVTVAMLGAPITSCNSRFLHSSTRRVCLTSQRDGCHFHRSLFPRAPPLLFRCPGEHSHFTGEGSFIILNTVEHREQRGGGYCCARDNALSR